MEKARIVLEVRYLAGLGVRLSQQDKIDSKYRMEGTSAGLVQLGTVRNVCMRGEKE